MFKLVSTVNYRKHLILIKLFKDLSLFYDSQDQCFRLFTKDDSEIPALGITCKLKKTPDISRIKEAANNFELSTSQNNYYLNYGAISCNKWLSCFQLFYKWNSESMKTAAFLKKDYKGYSTAAVYPEFIFSYELDGISAKLLAKKITGYRLSIPQIDAYFRFDTPRISYHIYGRESARIKDLETTYIMVMAEACIKNQQLFNQALNFITDKNLKSDFISFLLNSVFFLEKAIKHGATINDILLCASRHKSQHTTQLFSESEKRFLASYKFIVKHNPINICNNHPQNTLASDWKKNHIAYLKSIIKQGHEQIAKALNISTLDDLLENSSDYSSPAITAQALIKVMDIMPNFKIGSKYKLSSSLKKILESVNKNDRIATAKEIISRLSFEVGIEVICTVDYTYDNRMDLLKSVYTPTLSNEEKSIIQKTFIRKNHASHFIFFKYFLPSFTFQERLDILLKIPISITEQCELVEDDPLPELIQSIELSPDKIISSLKKVLDPIFAELSLDWKNKNINLRGFSRIFYLFTKTRADFIETLVCFPENRTALGYYELLRMLHPFPNEQNVLMTSLPVQDGTKEVLESKSIEKLTAFFETLKSDIDHLSNLSSESKKIFQSQRSFYLSCIAECMSKAIHSFLPAYRNSNAEFVLLFFQMLEKTFGRAIPTDREETIDCLTFKPPIYGKTNIKAFNILALCTKVSNKIEIPELGSFVYQDTHSDFVDKNTLFCNLLHTKQTPGVSRKRSIISPLSGYPFRWIQQLPDGIFKKPNEKYMIWARNNMNEGILSNLIQADCDSKLIDALLESEFTDSLYFNFKWEIETKMTHYSKHPYFKRFIQYFVTHKTEAFIQDILIPELVKKLEKTNNIVDDLKKIIDISTYNKLLIEATPQAKSIYTRKCQKNRQEADDKQRKEQKKQIFSWIERHKGDYLIKAINYLQNSENSEEISTKHFFMNIKNIPELIQKFDEYFDKFKDNNDCLKLLEDLKHAYKINKEKAELEDRLFKEDQNKRERMKREEETYHWALYTAEQEAELNETLAYKSEVRDIYRRQREHEYRMAYDSSYL